MPDYPKTKTAKEQHAEYEAAKLKEDREAKLNHITPLADKYQDKYFWFKRNDDNILRRGIFRFLNFKIAVERYGSLNLTISYDSQTIELIHPLAYSEFASGFDAPRISSRAGSDHYCKDIADFEATYQQYNLTPATKEDFDRIRERLRLAILAEFDAFDGKLPEPIPTERAITVDKL